MYAATLSTPFYAIGTVILLLTAILLVIVQPYKKKFATYNTTDTVLILLFAAIPASVNVSQMTSLKFAEMSVIIVLLTTTLPLFYLFVVIIHWLYISIHVSR